MMCQAILKAFTVKVTQTIAIPLTAADLIKASGMSTLGIVYQCGLKIQLVGHTSQSSKTFHHFFL